MVVLKLYYLMFYMICVNVLLLLYCLWIFPVGSCDCFHYYLFHCWLSSYYYECLLFSGLSWKRDWDLKHTTWLNKVKKIAKSISKIWIACIGVYIKILLYFSSFSKYIMYSCTQSILANCFFHFLEACGFMIW